MKYVVISHVHHADAGQYKLLVSGEIEHVVQTPIKNPMYNSSLPVSEDNLLITQELAESTTVLSPPMEITWADDDERWQDKSVEEIVDAQRKLAQEAIDKSLTLIKQTAAEPPVREFGGKGFTLHG